MSVEIPPVQAPSSNRSHKRAFVIIWSVLTLLIGIATFIAIFVATGFILGGPEPAVVSAAQITTSTPMNAASTLAVTPIPQITIVRPTTAPQGAAPAQPAATTVRAQEPTPEPTLSAMERTGFDFGIQVQESYDLYDYWATVVADQLHLDWIKQQVRWGDMEPTKGEIDWTILDIVVPIAHRKGITLMLSIVTAPDWAREAGADLSKHGPPANPQDYVNFVTAILRRYGSEYPGTIGAIEVWNEMNIDREWSSPRGLNTQNYVNLLAQTYNAVKSIDPGIIVISGALSPGGGWVEPSGMVSAMDDFDYLDALLRDGLLNYTDCVGAHHNGYNIGPRVPWDEAPADPNGATARFRGPFDNPHHSWSMYSTLSTYANKIRLAGGSQPLCVTEFGWAVSEDLAGFPRGFEFAQDNTLEEQRDYLLGAVQWFEESGFIWLAWIWNLNYGAQAGWDPNNDNVPYAILRPDSVPAPAWDAIAQYRLEHFNQE